MALESSLWKWLAKARQSSNLDMNRVENFIGSGFPDVEGYLAGHGSFTFELKSAARPARTNSRVPFKIRTDQIEWNKRRWSVGGSAMFLCQVGDGSERRVYALPGYIGALLKSGMTEERIRAAALNAECFIGPLDPLDVIVTSLAKAHSILQARNFRAR